MCNLCPQSSRASRLAGVVQIFQFFSILCFLFFFLFFSEHSLVLYVYQGISKIFLILLQFLIITYYYGIVSAKSFSCGILKMDNIREFFICKSQALSKIVSCKKNSWEVPTQIFLETSHMVLNRLQC